MIYVYIHDPFLIFRQLIFQLLVIRQNLSREVFTHRATWCYQKLFSSPHQDQQCDFNLVDLARTISLVKASKYIPIPILQAVTQNVHREFESLHIISRFSKKLNCFIRRKDYSTMCSFNKVIIRQSVPNIRSYG